MDRLEEDGKSVTAIGEILNKMSELLTISEKRIDKTHDLICKAFNMVDKLTMEYSKQIDKLQACRDDLVTQNTELIKITKNLQSDSESCNKRYDLLLEKFITLAGKNMSENNINVN